MRFTFRFLFTLLILSICGTFSYSQSLTLQEKLGYPKNTKLLILHADDLGVAHTVNDASILSMTKGMVSSGSIMVPCPWFPEIAAYARANPKADLGLHLTLTSEWKYFKWGPVSSKSDVPGLVNKNGFLYAEVDSVYRSAKVEEVERELRAQIQKAIQFGIDVTHFDSHMAACFGNAEYLKVLIKLGREFKVPVLLNKTGPRSVSDTNLEGFITDKDVQLDHVYTANPDDFKNGMENFYTKIFKSLEPGLSIILLHAGYDNIELQAMMIDHPDWGSAWRQADLNFFTSERCRKMLQEQNIRVITWREVRDKLVR